MTWAWLTRFWHTTPKTQDLYGLGQLTRYGFFILEALSTGPQDVIAMIAYVERAYHVRMLSGSVFAALLQLEEKGWIEALPIEERRQPYHMTPQGRDILRLYQARAQASRPA